MPVRETYALLPSWVVIPLYALLALCLCTFAFGMVRKLRTLQLRTLLADAPGRPSGPPRRFLRYVLLQSRILRRPGGWPHACFVVGTAGLAVGTLLVAVDWELLRPAGARLLRGGFYLGFEAALDGFGILLVAGTLAALLRMWRRGNTAGRFRRMNTLALCALFLLGVGGFLIEGLRLLMHPVPWGGFSFVGIRVAALLGSVMTPEAASHLYGVLWWSHAAIALGLLAALPFSSLLHVVTAPLNILASPDRPRGDLQAPFDLRDLIRTGNFDVRAGSSSLADLEPARLLSLLACTDCGRCDDVCPAHQSGSALSPRRMVGSLRREMDRRNGNTDLLEGALSDGELWACTTCASCVADCPNLVAPMDLVIPLRRELVTRQRLDHRQSEMLSALNRSSNPYGLPHADRGNLSRSLGLSSPGTAETFDYLYWIGCAGAYDERVGESARAAIGVLTKAGLRVTALGEEEACCGDPARRIGEEGLFQQLALRNIELLKGRGVARIVTHCAHCFNSLKNEYRRFGGDFEVVHHSELIAALLEEGRLSLVGDESETIAFHDSCYMGRFNGIYDAPRSALRALPGVRLAEMPRNRDRSFCCGGGGAGYWYDVPSRETPSALRMREAAATGATGVGVACPYCLKMLEASASSSGVKLPVRDVGEIVAASVAGGNGGTSDAGSTPKTTGGKPAGQVRT